MSSYGTASITALSTNTFGTAGTAHVATAGTVHATAAHAAAAGAAHAAAGAAAAAAGTVLIGGAVALGAGILIAQGMMWCGEKMEANYQEACHEWADFENKAAAENRGNAQEISNYLASQIEYLSINEFASAAPMAAATVNQQELAKAIARARGALKDPNTVEQARAATERDMLVARLRAEIKTGRGILPAAILAEAEIALTGPTESIQTMLDQLENAWTMINETSALQTRIIQQTRQLLTLVSAKLSAIDSMARDSEPAYQKRLRQLHAQVQETRDELLVQPEQALLLATRARQDTEALLEEISVSAHKSWSELRSKVNVQIGTLDALSQMLLEVETHQLVDLFDAQKFEKLKERIKTLKRAGKKLLDGDSIHMLNDRTHLTMAVENLKRDVFTEVETGQQSKVASLIQETLTELGFQSDTGEAAVIKRNGDIAHVEVMVSRPEQGQATASATRERSDRVITFDITRSGEVSYDFGGYIGAACVEDAQKVFAALHKKGIYLINEAAIKNLQGPLEQFVQEIALQEQSPVTPEKNKTQTELAEKIKGVLDQMDYQNVRVSSIGGSIEMEAFNGNTGYRVIMSPEGEIQIFDGQHTDITNKTGDPIVKVSHEVQGKAQEAEIKKRKKSSFMGSRKGHIFSH